MVFLTLIHDFEVIQGVPKNATANNTYNVFNTVVDLL